jgi:transcriptional regulator with XRE-family HTH domain
MSDDRKRKFGTKLRHLRKACRTNDGKGWTLKELSDKSQVDLALISAVERGTRNAGEVTLRKLAQALGLLEGDTRKFVLEGLSAAGSKQVLDEYKDYPAHFLHLLPEQVSSEVPGFDPMKIVMLQSNGGADGSGSDLMCQMEDGKWLAIQIKVAHGDSKEDAMTRLEARTDILRVAPYEEKHPK